MSGFSLDQLGDRTIDTLWAKIADTVGTWLHQHPRLDWLVEHPRWSLALLLLVVLLLGGLFGAIARLFQEFWIRLPQMVLNIFVGIGGWTVQRGFAVLQRPRSDRQTELKELLERLETNRREQDELLQRVKALLQETDPRE